MSPHNPPAPATGALARLEAVQYVRAARDHRPSRHPGRADGSFPAADGGASAQHLTATSFKETP